MTIKESDLLKKVGDSAGRLLLIEKNTMRVFDGPRSYRDFPIFPVGSWVRWKRTPYRVAGYKPNAWGSFHDLVLRDSNNKLVRFNVNEGAIVSATDDKPPRKHNPRKANPHISEATVRDITTQLREVAQSLENSLYPLPPSLPPEGAAFTIPAYPGSEEKTALKRVLSKKSSVSKKLTSKKPTVRPRKAIAKKSPARTTAPTKKDPIIPVVQTEPPSPKKSAKKTSSKKVTPKKTTSETPKKRGRPKKSECVKACETEKKSECAKACETEKKASGTGKKRGRPKKQQQ